VWVGACSNVTPDDSGPTAGRHRRRTFLASLVARGSLALAGCGSSGDENASGTTREPGDAGVDHETAATYYGSEATDVPEDFLVADHDQTARSVSVVVPEGARYLFAAAKDNLHNDNGDDGFGVGIVLP